MPQAVDGVSLLLCSFKLVVLIKISLKLCCVKTSIRGTIIRVWDLGSRVLGFCGRVFSCSSWDGCFETLGLLRVRGLGFRACSLGFTGLWGSRVQEFRGTMASTLKEEFRV